MKVPVGKLLCGFAFLLSPLVGLPQCNVIITGFLSQRPVDLLQSVAEQHLLR